MAAHNFRDIKGERFGKLTVKERDLSNPNGKTKWFCECDCGKVVSKYSYDLTKGIIKDCGCSRMIDLKNKRFGKLLVIERSEKISKSRDVIWDCKCDCGKTVSVSSRSLRNGLTKSCGCLHKLNLAGQKFGRLMVLEKDKDFQKRTTWKCLCDCGNYTVVRGTNLKSGAVKSCGCLQKSSVKKTHGMSRSSLYNIWNGMKNRCYNKNSNSYKDYGGRGIVVCDDWINNFENFCKWSLTNGYQSGLTIDRIDTNGNYCPKNCRWISKGEQAKNRRMNYSIEYKGENKTLKEICDELNIDYKRTHNRIVKLGWSLEKSINTPVNKNKRNMKVRKKYGDN